MWNLQRSSDTFKAWRDAENFAVNMLKAGQEDVSNKFARQGEHALDADEYTFGQTGCPLLADCLATLECVVHSRYEEGDHVILIGEVVDVVSDSDAGALTYYKGCYGAIGKT